MYSEPSYSGKPNQKIFPPEIQDLLLEEGSKVIGSNETALGTGIIATLGTARSGKTTLAYGMIDFVVHHTKRPVYLAGFPEIVINEGIPKHWEGRVQTRSIEDIYKVESNEPAVWLLDDSAVNHGSRDSMSKRGKFLARIAGVISHFGGGQTIIYTTQSLAGVDKSLFRFCETVTVVRYMANAGMKGERGEWREEVSYSQYLLHKANNSVGLNSRRLRSFYVTVSDHDKNEPYRIVPYVRPDWLFNDLTPYQKDLLSRPFRYMKIEDRELMINPTAPKKKRKSKIIEDEDNE